MNDRPDTLFLSSTHPGSGRSAIVEEVEGSVWLYLASPGAERPDDCWLANTLEPSEVHDAQHFRELSVPPPARSDFVDVDAVRRVPLRHRWELRWSSRGDAVAALCDGEAMGFIGTEPAVSYARHLVKDGPWGSAWSAIEYERLFGRMPS